MSSRLFCPPVLAICLILAASLCAIVCFAFAIRKRKNAARWKPSAALGLVLAACVCGFSLWYGRPFPMTFDPDTQILTRTGEWIQDTETGHKMIDILNRAAYRPEWNIYNKETEHPAPEGSVTSFLLYTPEPDPRLFSIIVVSVNENGSAYFIDCKNGMGNLRNKYRVDEKAKQELIQLYPGLKQAQYR